mmetsp:Transcript_107191/g.272027  ORF Transcript_107191/g.272027 Transcript_107191/m.272027 type:complete len:290 (+) Transcript_107191:1220-2089(+)
MAISNESVLAASKASWTPFASLKVTSTIFARSADLVIKLGREASSPNAAKVSRSTSTMDLSPMAKSSSEKLLRASRLLGVAVLAGAKSLIGTVPGTINGTTVGGTTVGGLTLGAAEAGTPFTRGGRTEGCFGLIGGSTILGATILGSTTFACPTTCGAVAATGSFLGAGSNRSRRGTDGVDPKGAAADAALADAAAFFASSSSCSFRTSSEVGGRSVPQPPQTRTLSSGFSNVHTEHLNTLALLAADAAGSTPSPAIPRQRARAGLSSRLAPSRGGQADRRGAAGDRGR